MAGLARPWCVGLGSLSLCRVCGICRCWCLYVSILNIREKVLEDLAFRAGMWHRVMSGRCWTRVAELTV